MAFLNLGVIGTVNDEWGGRDGVELPSPTPIILNKHILMRCTIKQDRSLKSSLISSHVILSFVSASLAHKSKCSLIIPAENIKLVSAWRGLLCAGSHSNGRLIGCNEHQCSGVFPLHSETGFRGVIPLSDWGRVVSVYFWDRWRPDSHLCDCCVTSGLALILCTFWGWTWNVIKLQVVWLLFHPSLFLFSFPYWFFLFLFLTCPILGSLFISTIRSLLIHLFIDAYTCMCIYTN